MSWITVKSYDEVNKGDLIIGTNYTWSLKYFDKFGYDQYNNTRKGMVISENHGSWFDIIIVNDWYILYPPVGIQYSNYSDINNLVVDYKC